MSLPFVCNFCNKFVRCNIIIHSCPNCCDLRPFLAQLSIFSKNVTRLCHLTVFDWLCEIDGPLHTHIHICMCAMGYKHTYMYVCLCLCVMFRWFMYICINTHRHTHTRVCLRVWKWSENLKEGKRKYVTYADEAFIKEKKRNM